MDDDEKRRAVGLVILCFGVVLVCISLAYIYNGWVGLICLGFFLMWVGWLGMVQ